MIPMSSACRDRICGGCTGYTDGHATWVCGHDCHRYDARGVQITAPGRRVAVVASPAQLAEDTGDVAVIKAAEIDGAIGSEPIPWEQVKDVTP